MSSRSPIRVTAVDEKSLIMHAARLDAEFVGRFVSSFGSTSADVGSVATFCTIGFLSLFAYESHARLRELEPQLASAIQVTTDTSDVMARSRHSLKLFEDTRRGIQGQLHYFGRTIIPTHEREFIGRVRVPFLRVLARDLGIYYYDGRPIASTHSASFAVGLNPESLFRGGSTRLSKIAEEYGRYFAAWGAEHSEGATSFITAMDPDLIGDKDVRSASEYATRFNGRRTPQLNALLGVFEALINTADGLFSLDKSPESRQTLLKMRYLSVYQVLRSLKRLLEERPSELTRQSMVYTGSIVNDRSAQLVFGPGSRAFRNSLMHYKPDRRIDLARLSLAETHYGLIQLCYSLDVEAFEEALSSLISETALTMHAWSSKE